jgi:FixJ family two-component response regulator
MPHQLENILKEGARNYLTKPLDVNTFIKVVDEFIPG